MKTKTIQALVLILSLLQLSQSLTLTGTVRDFKISHPDFEDFNGVNLGIVKDELGADKKPVYNGGVTTTGAANFNQWYNDVDGINLSTPFSIELTDPDSDGIYTYTNNAFFPIDNMLFENEGNAHNYHFTFELHTKFTYEAGQTFSFTGDDDLWVFINDHLEIDLGGVHGAMTASVDLDTLGLTPGNTYSLDLFFAERHTFASNFQIETSIELITDPCAVVRAVRKMAKRM